jgi:peroxin-12
MNILYNFNPADASRPSFFEMFIQTQMMPSLKPAIKYMFSILSQRIPILNWCLKYMDELFYGALFIMEKHYLKYYGTITVPDPKEIVRIITTVNNGN